MSRFVQFASLPDRKRSLLVRSFFLLALAKVALAVVGFRTVERYLQTAAELFAITSTRPPTDEINWAITTADFATPIEYSCLERGLVGTLLLEAAGYDPQLQFGVNKAEGDLIAHAWVEVENDVIVGELDELSSYNILSTEESISVNAP